MGALARVPCTVLQCDSTPPLSYKLSSIMNLLPVFISCVLTLAAAEVSGRKADTDNHRAGKLFFVATTVSTISTSTLCYTAAANLAPAPAGGRGISTATGTRQMTYWRSLQCNQCLKL